MIRSRCKSGEEYTYHLDQMNIYMENQIVWQRRVEDLTLQVPNNPSLVYQGCDKNLKAPTSYQLKVNLIAPTLTIPCIEDLSPCSIISIPFVGLIYKSSKKERRVMNTDEIPKFCDATLERVLKNGKKISLDVKHSFKDPPFNKEDSDLMRFFGE
ncbi:hypothetical protein Tco_0444977 [Tanacetum coccineum]